jgi:NADPH:quinone reductase-like Zn-dependent oxidoreductase
VIECGDFTRTRRYTARQDDLELFRQIPWAEDHRTGVHLSAREPAHPVDVLTSKVNPRLRFKVTNADEVAGIGLSVPPRHRKHPGEAPNGPVNLGIVQAQFFPELPRQCGLWSLAIIDSTAGAGPETAIDAKPLPLEVHEENIGLLVEYQRPDGLPETNPAHRCPVKHPPRSNSRACLRIACAAAYRICRRRERVSQVKAIVVRDQAAGTAGMTLAERPEPLAAINDVVVQVHAAGWVSTELEWPSTWTDRGNRDRTPSIPGHELAGVVTALGYGTTGLSVGQRVFGLADWHRDGTMAEYVAMEARNLAPMPDNVDFTVAASLPISGLTAWQGLFQHGDLQPGQRVLAHGAAGAVGAMVTQLATGAGAHVIGTGRAADREKALDFGAQDFVDLGNDALEDAGEVDLVFDVIGGEIQKRSAALLRAGGTLVSVVGPAEARPTDGRTVDFVVEADRAQLIEIAARVSDGRLRTNIGITTSIDDAVATFGSGERRKGKTIINIRP